MFAFPFSSGKTVGSVGESVGSVSDGGSGNFVRIEIEFIGDFVPLVVFVPRGVESKSGRLIGVKSKGG